MRLYEKWEVKAIDPLNIALYRAYISEKEATKGQEMLTIVGYYGSLDTVIQKIINLEMTAHLLNELEDDTTLVLEGILKKLEALHEVAYQYIVEKTNQEGL